MRVGSDRIFHLVLGCFVGAYVLLIVSMLVADASFTSGEDLWSAIQSPEIRAATILSLVSASLTALLSVWFAV
ncbi:MAG: molybdenum ABC transporter permease, partial [Planctomycetota bacterium]|nr:molybdenum ABC transporter permease [Planctomycetota bacterium]